MLWYERNECHKEIPLGILHFWTKVPKKKKFFFFLCFVYFFSDLFLPPIFVWQTPAWAMNNAATHCQCDVLYGEISQMSCFFILFSLFFFFFLFLVCIWHGKCDCVSPKTQLRFHLRVFFVYLCVLKKQAVAIPTLHDVWSRAKFPGGIAETWTVRGYFSSKIHFFALTKFIFDLWADLWNQTIFDLWAVFFEKQTQRKTKKNKEKKEESTNFPFLCVCACV